MPVLGRHEHIRRRQSGNPCEFTGGFVVTTRQRGVEVERQVPALGPTLHIRQQQPPTRDHQYKAGSMLGEEKLLNSFAYRLDRLCFRGLSAAATYSDGIEQSSLPVGISLDSAEQVVDVVHRHRLKDVQGLPRQRLGTRQQRHPHRVLRTPSLQLGGGRFETQCLEHEDV